MANRERPLSPHIQVYRWQITMTMSILHRTTGIILVVGAFALAWWLLAVAAGGDVYATAAACLASPIGTIALFGFSLSLVYHLLNGIRHMLWDIGWGFEDRKSVVLGKSGSVRVDLERGRIIEKETNKNIICSK